MHVVELKVCVFVEGTDFELIGLKVHLAKVFVEATFKIFFLFSRLRF